MAAATVVNYRMLLDAGGKRINVATVTFDATYPAGGESVTANELGLQRIDAVVPCSALASATTAWAVVPVVASGGASVSLRLFGSPVTAGQGTPLLENNTANQSATTVTILAIGV